MKNNNLIQEEINRAKQLWGYDKSKTIFEQTTGTTGCNAISSLTFCTGGTHNWYYIRSKCSIIDGQPLTQSHVGQTIIHNNWAAGSNQEATIDSITNIPVSNSSHNWTTTSCPTTGTTTCNAIPSFTFCTGGTYNWFSNRCITINGQSITQSDVGSVIQFPQFGAPNSQMIVDSVNTITPGNNTQTWDAAPSSCPIEDPCEEFNTWDRMEQRDFCEGCRRAPDEPMCKCCRDVWR